MYNKEVKHTQYFVENQMMLSQNMDWDPNGDNGKGDAIGRTFEAFICYEDKEFIDGIKRCWVKRMDGNGDGKYYYHGIRYPAPEYMDKDMSRDHTSGTIAALKYANDPFLKELVTHIKYAIRPKHKFNPSMWCWAKIFAGKWWAKPGFYIMSVFEYLAYIAWNAMMNAVCGFSKEMTPLEYIQSGVKYQKLPKWKQKIAKTMFPTYALHKMSWQIMVLEDKILKRILEKLLLALVPRHNTLIKLQLNGKVKKEDVLKYKSMRGGRWTIKLNETCDRDMRIIPDGDPLLDYNVQDVDIIRKLWNQKNPHDPVDNV